MSDTPQTLREDIEDIISLTIKDTQYYLKSEGKEKLPLPGKTDLILSLFEARLPENRQYGSNLPNKVITIREQRELRGIITGYNRAIDDIKKIIKE